MAQRTLYVGVLILIIVIAVVALMMGGGEGEKAVETTPMTTPMETTPRATVQETQAMKRELTIDAEDYEFEPKTIEVKPGETLVVKVKNTGRAFHTFTIDELNIDIPLGPGEEETVEITIPEGVDKITFYCRPHKSIGMVGEFVVA